jgi:hypothetical protein
LEILQEALISLFVNNLQSTKFSHVPVIRLVTTNVIGNSQPGGRQGVLLLTISLRKFRQLEPNYLTFQAINTFKLTPQFGTV